MFRSVAISTAIGALAVTLALTGPISAQLPLLWLLHGNVADWIDLCRGLTTVPHVVFAVLLLARTRSIAAGRTPVSRTVLFFGVVGSALVPMPAEAFWQLNLGDACLLACIVAIVVAVTGAAMVPVIDLLDELAQRERARRSRLPVARWVHVS